MYYHRNHSYWDDASYVFSHMQMKKKLELVSAIALNSDDL